MANIKENFHFYVCMVWTQLSCTKWAIKLSNMKLQFYWFLVIISWFLSNFPGILWCTLTFLFITQNCIINFQVVEPDFVFLLLNLIKIIPEFTFKVSLQSSYEPFLNPNFSFSLEILFIKWILVSCSMLKILDLMSNWKWKWKFPWRVDQMTYRQTLFHIFGAQHCCNQFYFHYQIWFFYFFHDATS